MTKTFLDAVQDEAYMKSTSRQKMLDLCRTLGEVTTLWAMSFPIGTTIRVETPHSAGVPVKWTLTVMFVQFDEQQHTRLVLAGSYEPHGFNRDAPESYWMYMGHEPGSIYPISVEEEGAGGAYGLTIREAREADLDEYLLLSRSLKQISAAFDAEKVRLIKEIEEGEGFLRAYFGEADDAP